VNFVTEFEWKRVSFKRENTNKPFSNNHRQTLNITKYICYSSSFSFFSRFHINIESVNFHFGLMNEGMKSEKKNVSKTMEIHNDEIFLSYKQKGFSFFFTQNPFKNDDFFCSSCHTKAIFDCALRVFLFWFGAQQ
jgi:hypothetical protein